MQKKMILAATTADPWMPVGNGDLHLFEEGEQLLELPPEWYAVFKKLGVTYLQFDSPHNTTSETSEGCWDWHTEDDLIEKCLVNGFQPMHFPHWHWPPPWFETSDDFTPLKCLQHNESLPCFSLWSPKIRDWYDRCIQKLREHHGSDEKIPAIYLGVYGDFGEPMYPMGWEIGPRLLEHHRGLEQTHWHVDFWCNDPYARKSFQEFLSGKYGSITDFNAAWSTACEDLSEAQYPADPDEKNPRPWLDFVQWYYDSMTEFTGFVAEIYRNYFPDALLMLPMGGGAEPVVYGQDNTGQPKAMKAHGVHIRTTNAVSTHLHVHVSGDESIPEKFQINYSRLKRIITAAKYYDLPVWLEPPYPPALDAVGNTTMIFEALCCGATGFYNWSRSIYQHLDIYEKYSDLMNVERPIVDTAVLFPLCDHRLRRDAHFPEIFQRGCAEIRKITDFDVLDDNLISDGALQNYRRLIIMEGNVFEQSTFETLRKWIEQGGVLLSYNVGPVRTVEGDTAIFNNLFGINASSSASINDSRNLDIRNKQFLKHMDKLADLSSKCVYTGLDSDIQLLAGTDSDQAVIWSKKIGKGYCIFFAGQWDQRSKYFELIRDAVYNLSGMDSALPDSQAINNDWDNVFSVVCPDKAFFLNLEEHSAQKTAWGKTITLQPYSIGTIAR